LEQQKKVEAKKQAEQDKAIHFLSEFLQSSRILFENVEAARRTPDDDGGAGSKEGGGGDKDNAAGGGGGEEEEEEEPCGNGEGGGGVRWTFDDSSPACEQVRTFCLFFVCLSQNMSTASNVTHVSFHKNRMAKKVLRERHFVASLFVFSTDRLFFYRKCTCCPVFSRSKWSLASANHNSRKRQQTTLTDEARLFLDCLHLLLPPFVSAVSCLILVLAFVRARLQMQSMVPIHEQYKMLSRLDTELCALGKAMDKYEVMDAFLARSRPSTSASEL